MTTFPREVLVKARELAESLRAQNVLSLEMDNEARKRRAILRFAYKLRSMMPILQISNDDAALTYLSNLRDQLFQEICPEIRSE